MISLSDPELQIIMHAAKPLPVEKRGVFLERVEAALRLHDNRYIIDDDVIAAAARSLRGLQQVA